MPFVMPSSQTDMDTSLSVKEQKKELRRLLRQKRALISKEDKQAWDDALVASIASHPCYRSCEVLLLFYPVKGEPDLLPLATLALSQGKKVGFPISHPDIRAMSFCAIRDPSELSEGTYGIPEPPAGGEILNDAPHALCLVPALAFDRYGYRLGYGGGYYDRFLAEFHGVSLAPTYHTLLCDRLPIDPYDRSVDLLITEKGEEQLYVDRRA